MHFSIRTLVMHCSRGLFLLESTGLILRFDNEVPLRFESTGTYYVQLAALYRFLVLSLTHICDRFSSKAIGCEENPLRSLYLVSIVSDELKSLSGCPYQNWGEAVRQNCYAISYLHSNSNRYFKRYFFYFG